MDGKKAGLVAAGILLFIILIQNTQVVYVHFLFWTLSMSQIILLPLVVLLGYTIGYLVGRRSW